MAAEPTNVCLLPVPAALQADPLPCSREQRIHQHEIVVAPDWWNTALVCRGLPGGPLRARPGASATGVTRWVLSRGDVFALARDLDQDEAVLRLLWHVLAWGSGQKLRLNAKRLATVAGNVAAVTGALKGAAVVARSDPVVAYELLWPGGSNVVRWLGPAFFTKFLYFAGGGDSNHPCLILDRRVARTLHACGWESLSPQGNWPAWAYGRYCRLVRRWAVEETVRRHRLVCPDEVERWLFERAKRGMPGVVGEQSYSF